MPLTATALGTDLGMFLISPAKSLVSKKFKPLSPYPNAHSNNSAPSALGLHIIPSLGTPLESLLERLLVAKSPSPFYESICMKTMKDMM